MLATTNNIEESTKGVALKNFSDNVWVVVPAFNEASVLESTLSELLQTYSKVVVVDDGSTDDTRLIALASGAIVLTHLVNLGQGAALQTGINYALEEGASHIVTFDSDGQHDPADISRLFLIMRDNDCDVVLGSRFVGEVVDLPFARRCLLKLAVLFTRFSTGLNLTDTHNGLRLLTANAAKKIHLTQNKMAHASEILEQISTLELSYCEAPVTVRYTDYSLKKGQRLSDSVGILIDLVIGRITK